MLRYSTLLPSCGSQSRAPKNLRDPGRFRLIVIDTLKTYCHLAIAPEPRGQGRFKNPREKNPRSSRSHHSVIYPTDCSIIHRSANLS